MNTFLRGMLLVAVFALPTAAFAQSVTQIDETQVEMIAYEVDGPDVAPMHAPVPANPLNHETGAHVGMAAGAGFNPASDVGLNSVYLHHLSPPSSNVVPPAK